MSAPWTAENDPVPHLLEGVLRARRGQNEASLVPYVMAGTTRNWTDHVRACARAGADAVEIGIPFSDPMLDGPVIQAAATRALANGATMRTLLREIEGLSVDVPAIAMTYSNVVQRHGNANFCRQLAEAGVAGLIVPDIPLDEIDDISEAASAAPLELVLLVAPSTRPERVARIAGLSRGFVYAVSTMGVTGRLETVSSTVSLTTAMVRGATSLPVLVGFGISTPEQAVNVVRHADGVIVASALVAQVLDNASPTDTERFVAGFRTALDNMAAC